MPIFRIPAFVPSPLPNGFYKGSNGADIPVLCYISPNIPSKANVYLLAPGVYFWLKQKGTNYFLAYIGQTTVNSVLVRALNHNYGNIPFKNHYEGLCLIPMSIPFNPSVIQYIHGFYNPGPKLIETLFISLFTTELNDETQSGLTSVQPLHNITYFKGFWDLESCSMARKINPSLVNFNLIQWFKELHDSFETPFENLIYNLIWRYNDNLNSQSPFAGNSKGDYFGSIIGNPFLELNFQLENNIVPKAPASPATCPTSYSSVNLIALQNFYCYPLAFGANGADCY